MIRLTAAIGVLIVALSTGADARRVEVVAVSGVAESDRAILGTIITNAVTDVKLCELALQKSENAEILDYCRSASADNGHIAVQAAALAARLGVADNSLLTSTQTPPVVENLSGLTGRDFERSFLLTQIAFDGTWGHAVRYALEFGSNPPLKRFEASVLPIIFRHLDGAETVLRRFSETPP